MKIDVTILFYRISLCLCLILFDQVNIHSQSLEKLMSDAKKSDANKPPLDYKTQIKNLEQLLDNTAFAEHQDTLGILNYAIAFRYNRLLDYAKVIEYTSKAIEAFQSVNYNDYQYPTCLLMRGKSHLNIGEMDDAIHNFELIINKVPISGKGYRSLNEAYQKRSLIYRMQGEYESAIHNINSYLTTNAIDSVNRYGKASIYLELSIAHAKRGGNQNLNLANETIEKAIKHYAGVELMNDFDVEQKVLNTMHQAFIMRELGDLEKAKRIYQEQVNVLRTRSSVSILNNLLIVSMINLSQLSIENNNCEEALEISKEAEKLFILRSNSKFIETTSELLLVTAESYLCLGENQKALEYLYSGESSLLEDKDSKSALNLRAYVFKDFLIKNKIRQLNAEYNLNQNKILSQNLIYQTEYIDSLIGYYLEDMYFNSSKIELKNELDEFYKLALDIAFESDDLDKFWYFSEKRSNLLLLEKEEDKSVQNDPEYIELDKKLEQVKRRSADIENQLFTYKDSSDLRLIDSLENLLIKEKFKQLQLLGKRTRLGVYKSVGITSLLEFKNNTEPNKVWISYQFGTYNLYALMMTNSEVKLINLGKSSAIKIKIRDWFSSISKKLDSSDEIQQLNFDSEKLYNILIKPLGKLPENIIIIPDEELYYLSFDALQSSEGNYLIEYHNVSYDLSGTFAHQHRLRKSEVIKSFSVFQPSYENSDYSELVFTSKDYESLVHAKELTIYEKDQTTKHNFITSLEQSDIVHFGGHARHIDENNQYSHLALMSGDESISNMISLGDLYSIDIQSQLVALPACNTGMGSILQGEGISNLTRGFFYGGADAVISSLWEVDDKSTSKIINEFYKNLKAGKNKSESLRQAKLSYLKSVPDFLKHPNLWSGLILTGSDEEMNFNTSFKPLFLGILAGIIFLIFVFYWMRKRVKIKSSI